MRTPPDSPTPSAPPTLRGSFAGHETFTVRYAWLKKGVDGLAADPDLFTRDEAMVRLGVGKNMVRAIRHWCLATQVIQEGDAAPGARARRLHVSDLGRSLFLGPAPWDPYLEDDGSLWLLHWRLATNPDRATTWYWAFNRLKEQEFTRESLLHGLSRLKAEQQWGRVADSSLKADISCFLRTYAPGKRGPASTAEETLDCPLTSLGLLSPVGAGAHQRFRFHNGPKPGLPAAVFCAALLECWQHRHPAQTTLSLREIVHGEGGPGRVFRLDDDAVLSHLDALDGLTGGRLAFQDTALVRQVVRRAPVAPAEVLEAHYAH